MDARAVGRRLAAARGDRVRSEVANALGISNMALFLYESGERMPRDELKERFAEFYGTTVGALFFGEEVHG